MADEGQTATAVIDAPDMTDTSAERTDYGPREIRSHEMEPQEFTSNGTNPDVPHFTVTELDQMEPEALIELARTFEIQGFSRMKRPDLISRLLRSRTEMEGNIFGD